MEAEVISIGPVPLLACLAAAAEKIADVQKRMGRV